MLAKRFGTGCRKALGARQIQHVLGSKVTDRFPVQACSMRHRADGPGNILDQGSYIGTFRTMHPEDQPVAAHFEQADIVNPNAACLTFNDLSLAGQFIQAYSVLLQRRIHRRHLLDFAAEPCQDFFPAVVIQRRDFGCRRFLAVGIAGIGGDAETCRDPVDLVRVEEVGAYLGCLTETQRQHAGCRRVQTPRVAGLFCLKQLLDLLQRLVRRDACRLVQEQQAVDRCSPRPVTNTCCHCRLPVGVCAVGVLDQLADLHAMGNAIVVQETKLRYMANLQRTAEFATQET